mgnify:CR=1 FL=1
MLKPFKFLPNRVLRLYLGGSGIDALFRQYLKQQAVAQLKLLHDRRGQFGGIVVAAFHKQRGLVLVHGDFGRGGTRIDHKNAKHADLTGN